MSSQSEMEISTRRDLDELPIDTPLVLTLTPNLLAQCKARAQGRAAEEPSHDGKNLKGSLIEVNPPKIKFAYPPEGDPQSQVFDVILYMTQEVKAVQLRTPID